MDKSFDVVVVGFLGGRALDNLGISSRLPVGYFGWALGTLLELTSYSHLFPKLPPPLFLLVVELQPDLLDLLAQDGVVLEVDFNLFVSVDDSSVVSTTKLLPDIGIRGIKVLAE